LEDGGVQVGVPVDERCTCALPATAEMVISDPLACMSASAWWTRCRRRSTSRRRALASGVSPVVMGRSSGAGGRADAGHAEVDELAGLADHGDRIVDQGLVVLSELTEVSFYAADQLPQLGDLFLARGELGFGPVLQFGGGLDPLAVGEQLLQVGLELGQVGRVAAEVPAAQAGELVGAGLPAALTLDGSVQTPNGTATRIRACSSASRPRMSRNTRRPWLSNWWPLTRSIAARTRFSETR